MGLSPGWSGRVPLFVALAAALSLFLPIAESGLWDPHELRAIDLARRIAIAWFGGADLELGGLSSSLPTRGEVGQGELPFTSMAVGLRLFGLAPWAGRLPLALFAAFGLLATYAAVARLVDRKAAAMSAVVLATTPLYYVHARTALGDAVTMAALAAAASGLAVAVFDRSPFRGRLPYLALGLAGLVAGGLSRGLLIGVAVPALGIALAWSLLELGRVGASDALGARIAGVSAGLGAVAFGFGMNALVKSLAEPERYFALLGFGVSPPGARPTFDAVVHQLGHGLFPWSALVPLAVGRIVFADNGGDQHRRGAFGLLVAMASVAVLAGAAYGGLAPIAGVLPFSAVMPLAVLVGVALADFDRGAPLSRVFVLSGAALALLLVIDFRNFPDELLGVFGLGPLKLPVSFRDVGMTALSVATLVAAALLTLALYERPRVEGPAFARADYSDFLRAIRDLWKGNLLFAILVLEAALFGFLVFDLLGQHFAAFERFAAKGHSGRMVARTAWLVPPLLVGLPLACTAARDGFRFVDLARTGAARRFLPERGALALAGFAALGLGLSLAYYPALARRLSPEDTFHTFRRVAEPGEPVGMIGKSQATPYYARRDVVSFAGAEEAQRWLFAPGGRRFLVFAEEHLAGLNARYRAKQTPPANLPVLDANSSELMLASNRLDPGERSENPLDAYLLQSAPRPTRALDANLGDQLEVLGWDVTDLDDAPVREVMPGRQYRFVIYYRVVARISGNWETFVHIDGFQRRFNADHKTLGGRYPFALWQVGDHVADRHEFELEPNFTAGTYRVYFGLYSGGRRVPVKRGPHHEDRVDAGPLVIR